jgi:hypothetical protein
MMSSTNQDTIAVTGGVDAGITAAQDASAAQTDELTAADRTKLIQRMLRDALDEPSAVAANLQVNGGDLLEMSIVLKTAVMEAAKSSSNIAELKDLQSFFDTYVRICRQADRVLRLKHEIAGAQSGTSSAPSGKVCYEGE